jgi:uncharacterized SAM-binding protein YcdF (DUF218 family)
VSESKSKMRRWLVAAGILIVLGLAGALVFFKIGTWLMVQDPLTRADVIIVLSGSLPERAVQAAEIYKAGYADQVWVSPPISPVDELKSMNISYLGEDFYNEKVLLAEGVRPDAIRLLDQPSANTEEEVREISKWLHANNFHRAIVVTSKPHTRRVRTIWGKLIGTDPHLIVRFAASDPYDGAHWWRHTHDALEVVRETLGLFNAWAGFPLRPSHN